MTLEVFFCRATCRKKSGREREQDREAYIHILVRVCLYTYGVLRFTQGFMRSRTGKLKRERTLRKCFCMTVLLAYSKSLLRVGTWQLPGSGVKSRDRLGSSSVL